MTNCSTGSTPTASPPPRCRLATSIGPACNFRESAVNSISSPFWMMMESPKVTSKGGNMSSPSVKFSRPRCNT